MAPGRMGNVVVGGIRYGPSYVKVHLSWTCGGTVLQQLFYYQHYRCHSGSHLRATALCWRKESVLLDRSFSNTVTTHASVLLVTTSRSFCRKFSVH
ncbi:hypothetical protein AVEN_32889-1 [Araneus ventricosus]|uniref:Uncharacterized protein n=1 Tax=Araneus ventricosus TaxID=182803 RepID=A0A4Y2QUS7_ARAVE|nr:hypothetical protein AVEN_32889-1 [Araneus ventricosus]